VKKCNNNSQARNEKKLLLILAVCKSQSVKDAKGTKLQRR